MDEAAARQLRPATRLHGPADLQRQLVEAPLPGARLDSALASEPPEIAVGADVVEAVIVDADVGQVRRHAFDRPRAPQLEECGLAGRVELQQRRAELESLRPLGPPARAITAFDREYGRAVFRAPGIFDRTNLRGRQLEHPRDLRQQIARRPVTIQAQRHFRKPLARSQFASSRGHSASAWSCCPRPVPCGPFLKMCISAGTPALRSARK